VEFGSIDLFQILQQFQVDFLLKIAFSETTKHLEESKDTLGLTFHARFAHWASWQAVPGLERLIFKPPFLSYFLKSAATPTWARLAGQKFQSRQATKRSTPQGHKGDLLDQYLDAAEKHKDTVSPALIQRMISSTISAGFDTTAFTMTTILYYLLKNPSTLAKLQKDIDDAVSAGRLSDPPKFHEADKLEYLSATMKEAMRCYPFLNLPLERIVPDGGATIAGQWFPGDTVVGCHPSIVHRDATIFGSDPGQFRPERWRVRMERASLGFGNGKRICLGRHLAELEIKKVIPTLLMRFQVRTPCAFSRC
jgi:cytochrome P450